MLETNYSYYERILTPIMETDKLSRKKIEEIKAIKTILIEDIKYLERAREDANKLAQKVYDEEFSRLKASSTENINVNDKVESLKIEVEDKAITEKRKYLLGKMEAYTDMSNTYLEKLQEARKLLTKCTHLLCYFS